MKLPLSSLLLVASIVINITLVVLLVRNTGGPERAEVRNALNVGDRSSNPELKNRSIDNGRISEVAKNIQGEDARSTVARLRAAGYPSWAIRALIAAQLNQQFAERRKALIGKQEQIPYWKSARPSTLDPKTLEGLRNLSQEQNRILREALGDNDDDSNDGAAAARQRQYGDLSKTKVAQLEGIVNDYGDLRNEVYSSSRGVILPEDVAKLELLKKEEREDLVKLLSPSELEEYDLRSSGTANQLRAQLAAFDPTEEEFRALFRVQKAFDDKFGDTNGPMSAAQNQLRQAAQAQLADQMRAALSPQRAADFAAATDPMVESISRLVDRLGLPSSATSEVVSLQKSMMQKATEINADATLTPVQRNDRLTGLAREANDKLTTTLGGAAGFEAYKQYGGQWLQMLAPAPLAQPAATVGHL